MVVGSSERSLSPLQGALLGLLASEPEAGVSVARAIKLLWKPAPPERLRHRISQLVYSVNRGFAEPAVVKTRDRYLLGSTITSDYLAVTDAIGKGQPKEAAVLFGRGFLSELTALPTDAFSDWLDAKRWELRAQIRQASVEQWTNLTGQGRWRRATAPAQALVSLDPDDEWALRMLIRARAMAGRVREAEAAFLSFVERAELDDEDWTPEAETLSLVERMRAMGAGAGSDIAARLARHPPLIGRADELTALSSAIYPRPGDGLRLVVIRGERGSGKTRLVEETLARGLLKGVRAFRGKSSEFERGVVLHPILDALAIPDVAHDIAKLTDPWRSTLLELLPELQSGQEMDPAPTQFPVDRDRVPRRFLEAIRQLLVGITKNEPAILFLDDFQWADPTSIAALRYLGRRWPSHPLAVVFAVQPECLQRDDLVNRFLADPGGLCGEPSETSLRELSIDAAHELVQALTDTPIEVRTRDRIVELSGCNPYFILELTRLHLAGKELPRPELDERVPLPPSLARVYRTRLASLDDDAERVLTALSVSGRATHARPLSTLAGLSADRCMEALERLQHLRLVLGSPNGWMVRHKLIRQAVYDRMSTARRTWVHGQVARHLEEVERVATSRELAIHYHHALMRGRALQHALAGARQAEKANAIADASNLLALARRNTDDPLAQASISDRRARLHYLRRDPDNAPARLAEAATQLRKVHRPQSALVAEIQRLDMLASSSVCSAEEAARRAREFGRSAEKAELWNAFSKAVDLELRIYRREGLSGEADQLATEVERRLDQVELGSRGSLYANLALHQAGDFEAALGHARQAASIARRTCEQHELLRCLVCLIDIHGIRGRIRDAESMAAADEGVRLAAQGAEFIEHHDLLASLGSGYLAIGETARARTWLAKAEAALAEVHICEAHVSLACSLGELALAERRLEEADVHFARAQQSWLPGMGRYLGVISHSGAGLVALLLGRLDRVRLMESLLPEPPASWFGDPSAFVLFKAKMHERRGCQKQGADLISEAARAVEKTLPAAWTRLKCEEARLRMRHSLPQQEETVETAVRAATQLGADGWANALEALRRRAR